MSALCAISLYSGAGGLDYGFEAAGFETRVALDIDKDSCSTLRASRNWPVLCRDIHDTPTDELLSVAGLKEGQADILIGGPPCQPFSKSAYWASGDSMRLQDPRARTLEAYMRVVREALPQVFLLENVHGIAYSGKEEGFLYLQRITEEINKERGVEYALSWAVLNAVEYGVPQKRRRFFLVAHREGKPFRFPAPTHADLRDEHQEPLPRAMGLAPYVTAWDAIGEMEPAGDEDLSVRGRWAALLPSIPEGENYLWHTNRRGGHPLFGWRTRYWSFLLKLAKALPSWTIQAQPGPAIGPFHWKNRRLSVEELARLQTFPKNVHFIGSRLSVQRQIGNAVPSLLAEIIAREIAAQFFGMSYSEPPTLHIPYERPIPAPEPIAPVPREYLCLLGDHADHPGEGRGPRAAARAAEITS